MMPILAIIPPLTALLVVSKVQDTMRALMNTPCASESFPAGGKSSSFSLASGIVTAAYLDIIDSNVTYEITSLLDGEMGSTGKCHFYCLHHLSNENCVVD